MTPATQRARRRGTLDILRDDERRYLATVAEAERQIAELDARSPALVKRLRQLGRAKR